MELDFTPKTAPHTASQEATAYHISYPDLSSGSAQWGFYPNESHFNQETVYQETRAALGRKSVQYGLSSLGCIGLLMFSTQFLGQLVPLWLYITIPTASVMGVIGCSAVSMHYLSQESKLYQMELHQSPGVSAFAPSTSTPSITLPSRDRLESMAETPFIIPPAPAAGQNRVSLHHTPPPVAPAATLVPLSERVLTANPTDRLQRRE